MKIVALDTVELCSNKDDLNNRCVMCRTELNKYNISKEHIYPKWLLGKYNMYDQELILPNKSKMPYRFWTVNCCTKCNGTEMSAMEKLIKEAINSGYTEFVKLEEEVIVWWIMKIYYSKLYKETQMKMDRSNPDSGSLIKDSEFEKYDNIFIYMSELFKKLKFKNPKPYELFIFKTKDETEFDYMDDISTNTIYIRLNDIMIVCVLNSFGIVGKMNEREINALSSIEEVHFYQVIELFSKMVYFRMSYALESKHNYEINHDGAYVNTELENIREFRKYSGVELHQLIINTLSLRGLNITTPYTEGKMMSLIFNGSGKVNTYEDVEKILVS